MGFPILKLPLLAIHAVIANLQLDEMKCEENSLFSKQIDAFQLKVIFDFLLDLFNNIPISLRSSMINQNQLNITPEYFGLKKCSSVFYLFQRMPIPDHELHYLFENIQVSEDMTINGEVSDEFRLNTAKFSTNELNIRPAHWITRDIFLSLNCSRMCLDYVSLTMNDFQSFVLQWLDSENTSFVWLQMSFTGNHEPIDFSQFQTQQWNPKVRERYYEKCEENSLFSKQIDELQLKVIFNFLLDLFNNIPISEYTSMINENQLNITPEYFGLKKCSSVFHSFQGMPIPDDELRYLFENIQVSETITINGSVNDEFRLNTTKFSTNELNIRPAHWITRDIFLSLNCSRMCLDYVSLTMNDFQSFVLQWLSSENTSFVWLQMSFPGNHEPIDFSQFQTQQWDPKVRERYYNRGCKIDCLDGRDIRRKDGKLGTIGYFRRKHYFVVWNQTN
ncbi:unnamed protein product [Caenorhabditis brenneri]